MPHPPDLRVVGAGPAGLAVAIAAVQHGLRVRIEDAAPQGPIDKACGEGLLPGALASLARLGIRNLHGHLLAGIRFHAAGRTAEARFPSTQGLGVRRTELHRALLTRAAELGIAVQWNTPFRTLDPSAFTIAADGAHSRVRAVSGLGEGRITSRRIGLRQHFALAPWSPFVEVFWAGHAQAYVTPVSADQVGIAFLSQRKFQSIAEALTLFPELRDRLSGASPTSTPRGALTVTRRLSRVTTPHAVLAGDASGSVDAITGEGMDLCFRQAEALALALVTGDLAAYQQAHTRILRMPRMMSSALLLMDRFRPVRTGAMAVLSTAPPVFAALLRLHLGSPSHDRPHTPLPAVMESSCTRP